MVITIKLKLATTLSHSYKAQRHSTKQLFTKTSELHLVKRRLGGSCNWSHGSSGGWRGVWFQCCEYRHIVWLRHEAWPMKCVNVRRNALPQYDSSDSQYVPVFVTCLYNTNPNHFHNSNVTSLHCHLAKYLHFNSHFPTESTRCPKKNMSLISDHK